MYLTLTIWLIAAALPILVVAAGWFLQKRAHLSREKLTPYECGFDPVHTARIPFSLRFFTLAVLFLVFDIELTLLLPLPMISNALPLPLSMLCSFIFLMILTLGLIHEWREGTLEWAK